MTAEPVTASKLSLAAIQSTANVPNPRTPIPGRGAAGGGAWAGGVAVLGAAAPGAGGGGWQARRTNADEARLEPPGAGTQLCVLEGHLNPVALAIAHDQRGPGRQRPQRRPSSVRVEVDRALGGDDGLITRRHRRLRERWRCAEQRGHQAGEADRGGHRARPRPRRVPRASMSPAPY